MKGFLLVCLLLVGACTGAVLDCPPLPPHVPANVSDLRPGDIKVIMTLGDSISAGFGIQGAIGLLTEYRGLSWSIGGNPGAVTLANFLKFYNPNLQGASQGSHLVEICYGILCPPFQYRPSLDVLNSAQSGAMVSDLVHELSYLVVQLLASPKIDFKEDWKLLTLFIGANDLCGSCTLLGGFLTPNMFETHLTTVLESVRKTIPRVFVQIVEIFNISQVYDLSLKTKACAAIHRAVFIECDCIFSPSANRTRQEVDEFAQSYNERSRRVAANYQKLNYPDFAVVAQPFGRNTKIRDQPTALLSTLDCFHPSLMAHEGMAIALWNNLLTPAAKKKTFLDLGDKPLCPTEDTRLFTD